MNSNSQCSFSKTRGVSKLPALLMLTATWLYRFRRLGCRSSSAKNIALLFFLLLPFFTGCVYHDARKAYWDGKVKELCAKDGGITVYETVELPPDRFDKFGTIYIPPKDRAGPEDDYYYEWNAEYLRASKPELRRDHSLIYRASDGKLLGEAVSYSRVGGDPIGPWHHSSFQCPQDSGNVDLGKHIFFKNKY